jgi:DNA polymerase III alpha subunit
MAKEEKNFEVKKFDHDGNELAIRFGLGGIKAVGLGMIEEMTNKRQKHGQFKDIYDFCANAGLKTINKKSLEALSKSGSFDNIHSSRSQIVESVEILSKFAAAKDEEKNSNQMSLFGAANIEEELPPLKKADIWDKKQKLKEEFTAFGFFLSEHPLDDFRDALGKRGVISSENLEEIDDNHIINLAGVVAYSKHKSGPRGRYAYLTMSDPFGIYETAIFNEELITQHRDDMADGNSLVVNCLIKKDEGGTRVLVKEINKLSDFIKNTAAKKEIYQDIKQQERRKDFDWKKRKQENSDEKDALVEQMEHQKKIDALKAKKIVDNANIKIAHRDDILKIKGFLSQKLAPEDFDKFTKVYLEITDDSGQTKVELGDKYLLDEEDLQKIG